jgi:hypothetical protein
VNIIENIVCTGGALVIIIIGLLLGLCLLVSSLLIMYFCQGAIMDFNPRRIMRFPDIFNLGSLSSSNGVHSSVTVKALGYKPEGRGFEI